MKIFLNQQEIEEAVREHVEKTVTLKEGSEMSLDFLAGRGENGISVTVDIKYMGVETLDLTTAGTKETAKPPKAAAAAVPKTTLPKTKGATTVGGGLAGAAQSVVGNSKPLDLSAPDTTATAAASEQAAEAGAEATTAATEPSTDVVDAGDGSQDAEAGTTGEEAAAASTEAAADTGAKPVKSLFS